MEDMRNQAAQEAAKQRSIDMAKEMLKDGMLSVEKIAEYSMLSVDDVKSLQQNVIVL